MPFKLQAAMASRLRDEIKPRRFDLTMSRRTRRPAAPATLATSCHEPLDPDGLFCLSDHLQSWQPELDARQVHETSEQGSQHTTKEQASPPLTCRLQKKDDDESEAQQQEEEECQDNSRRFSLQELIEDEAVDDDVKDADTGGTEESAAAGGVREVAAGEAKRPGQQVAGRRVIGIMRRYVKVRSIKPKRASPEKNATPVC